MENKLNDLIMKATDFKPKINTDITKLTRIYP